MMSIPSADRLESKVYSVLELVLLVAVGGGIAEGHPHHYTNSTNYSKSSHYSRFRCSGWEGMARGGGLMDAG